ncbi:hypothetical protein EDB92DRAFT_1996290 [Lactarius akahatsu]|uniref:Protein kinase domain-containing protein n=1 Tax=Lactarius akahatsu TaxID=416441 RepID=A0AAD4LJD6_9AGAM|nr:hypothetical protein EDB92DRAFT_1996290 [Lactarius akahatsu]
MELVLLKVDIDPTPHLGAIQDLRADHNVQMNTARRVDEIWPDQPNEYHLHICVRLPSVIPQKRSVPQQGDVHSQFKRTKVATLAPSSLAASQRYVRLQQDSRERILDDRPEPDHQIPPIPLLYSGFGHFLDIMDGRNDVPGLANIKVAELQMAVDALATEMTRFFELEFQRREKGLEHLKDIFAARRGTTIPRTSVSAIGSAISDGHNVANNGTSSIVVEFKNSPTEVSAVPQVQVAGFVAHLNAALKKEAYLQWRVPCLGLTIVGCDITFYAVLAVDHQIRLVSLTPTLSCVQSASDGRDPASVLQAQLLENALKLDEARKLLKDPTAAEIPAGNRRYPTISQLSVSKYATSRGLDDYLTFEICGLLDDRVLYKAKRLSIDELILIKFVRRYSIDLHHICAKAGHAPSILGYERLPGGWFAVAMEYVKPDTSITESTHRVRWKQELETLMKSFHAENLVHGDLRDANIIYRGDSVILVDFDWGGKVGEASYPTLALNSELLDGRVTDNLMISISDDVRVLRKTLDKL